MKRSKNPEIDERIRHLWGRRRLVPMTCAQIAEQIGVSERRVRKEIAGQLAAVSMAQKGRGAVDPIQHGQTCQTNLRIKHLMDAAR